MKRLGLFLLTLLITSTVCAVLPDEVLSDPALEARARAISQELRCLVCQNQSIDESDAPLARDLRLIVRERLTAGESDADVKSFLVERYGSYVLLKPPFNASTLALWLMPVILLMLGGIGALFFFRAANRQQQAENLSADQQRQLHQLLNSSDE